MGPMRSMTKLGWPKAALLAVVAVVAAGAVVATVGGGADSRATRSSSGVDLPASDDPGGTVGSPPQAGMPEVAPAPADAMSAPGAKAVPPEGTLGQAGTLGGPRVVRTADLTLRVGDGSFSRAFDAVTAAATAEGGYVTGSTTSTASGDGREGRPRSGELTVRVPADRFDNVRRNLAGLGTVEQEQIRGEDVTAQIVDYDARLKSLQAEEDALRTLVGRATAVGEVLQVQSQLFQVRQQVESLQAQRDQLDRQATFATLRVSLMEPGAGAVTEPPTEPTGLAQALDRALDGSVAVVGGTIVVLGWLAPLGLVALMVWGVVRLRRRGAARVAPGASVS